MIARVACCHYGRLEVLAERTRFMDAKAKKSSIIRETSEIEKGRGRHFLAIGIGGRLFPREGPRIRQPQTKGAELDGWTNETYLCAYV